MQKDFSLSINKTDPDEIPLRSLPKAYFICIVMCLSAVYHGYCLTLIPAISTPQLRAYYHISVPLQLMLSLLNGIYPVGALVGCLILPFFIGKTNKKYALIYLGTSFTYFSSSPLSPPVSPPSPPSSPSSSAGLSWESSLPSTPPSPRYI